MRIRFAIAAVLTSMCLPFAAHAAFVEEYFNGYGSGDVNLSGLGSTGGGWAGAWANDTGPNYQGGSQLTYTATGYSNLGNSSGTTDGRAHEGGGATTNIATRTLATGMTGTVWVSALMSDEGGADFAAALVLDVGAATTNSLRIVEQGTDTDQRSTFYNGAENQPGAGVGMGAYVDGTVGLLLVRVDMDHNGSGHDRVTAWFNPDLSGGQSTIGSGFLVGETVDVFGPTFDGLGVAFSRGNGVIDAIRISNDANGFQLVTTAVPEPTAPALLGCLGLAALRRRR